MDIEKIGKAIKYLRQRAGYTQLELAERLMVSDKAVSRWERGKGIPDVSLLRRISIILDTDIDSLLEGSVAVSENSWKGLLYIDYAVDIIIYDKPLVDYLLSYFMLVKVRDIIIFASYKQIGYIQTRFGNGDSLNISLSYYERDNEPLSALLYNHQELFANSNVMILYGPCILYGTDLTRFLRRGMLNEGKNSTLLMVKNDPRTEVYMNEDKNVVKKADTGVILQYHYSLLPFLYVHSGIKSILGEYCSFEELIDRMIDMKKIYAEPMDKGFVDFDARDYEEILRASFFISIVQKQTGTMVCDVKEIAIRRGFIRE